MACDQLVRRFEFDRWSSVAPALVQAGDEIIDPGTGEVVIVERREGNKLLAAQKEPGDIIIDLSLSVHYPYTSMVMDLLLVGRVDYDDGTTQLRDDEMAPGVVFSPRLPPDDLEGFCRLHVGRYELFQIYNATRIQQAPELPYPDFIPFW